MVIWTVAAFTGHLCRTMASGAFAVSGLLADAVNAGLSSKLCMIVLPTKCGVIVCRKQAVEDFLDDDELELARSTAVQARAVKKPCSWPWILQ